MSDFDFEGDAAVDGIIDAVEDEYMAGTCPECGAPASAPSPDCDTCMTSPNPTDAELIR